MGENEILDSTFTCVKVLGTDSYFKFNRKSAEVVLSAGNAISKNRRHPRNVTLLLHNVSQKYAQVGFYPPTRRDDQVPYPK